MDYAKGEEASHGFTTGRHIEFFNVNRDEAAVVIAEEGAMHPGSQSDTVSDPSMPFVTVFPEKPRSSD